RTGEMGLVLRSQRLDQTRLVAYVRDQLQKSGGDLVSVVHGRQLLWSARGDPDVAGFFPDARTFVLGAGGWAPRMADLVDTARGQAERAGADAGPRPHARRRDRPRGRPQLRAAHLADRAPGGGPRLPPRRGAGPATPGPPPRLRPLVDRVGRRRLRRSSPPRE